MINCTTTMPKRPVNHENHKNYTPGIFIQKINMVFAQQTILIEQSQYNNLLQKSPPNNIILGNLLYKHTAITCTVVDPGWGIWGKYPPSSF